MRKIAIYGKGGIGKSTLAQNMAAALAQDGARVLLVGCDPKSDSTRLLLHGRAETTVLQALVDFEVDASVDALVRTGFAGIDCVESGGPEPGVGCAGRGIITAISYLEQEGVYDRGYDYVIYDVLGDVVCGGFAMPIREGKADEVYIVCSGEMMSLYAANNIAKGVERYANRGQVRLGGLVCNARMVEREAEIVSRFSERIGSRMLCFVPRDNVVQRAELARQTVMEHAPECNQAQEYRNLAKVVAENRELCVPRALSVGELEAFFEGIAEFQ